SCVRGGPGTPPACGALAAMMRAAAANPTLRPIAANRIESLQQATAERVAKTYLDESPPATFKVIVNPLVTWIWVGGGIALLGAIVALWPSRRRAAVAPGATRSSRR